MAAIRRTVTAIEPIVEQTTRNMQVQATLNNPKGKLRPGMFVQTELSLGAGTRGRRAAGVRDQLRAVRRLRVHRQRPASGEDGKSYRGVRQQFVKLGGSRGDQVAIVSGVKPGEEVVTSGVFKLRNGAAVRGEQQGAAGESSRAPKPEDS